MTASHHIQLIMWFIICCITGMHIAVLVQTPCEGYYLTYHELRCGGLHGQRRYKTVRWARCRCYIAVTRYIQRLSLLRAIACSGDRTGDRHSSCTLSLPRRQLETSCRHWDLLGRRQTILYTIGASDLDYIILYYIILYYIILYNII